MHLHILGICGTFMGGIAVLARDMGHTVTGSDQNVYPPMSTLLEQSGIEVMQGYSVNHLQPAPDMVVIGNTLSRGNESVEYVLNNSLPFTSGPQWLGENVLAGKRVLAVSGTHGKTTTTSMLAWILESAGKQPGFLIGGVAENFGVSARNSRTGYFVVEADEYDSAFFDKRSKFIHYHPGILVINNIEFDHADIFDDIGAVRRQFHHLLKTVPGSGRVITRYGDPEIQKVLALGCWSRLEEFGIAAGDWTLAHPRPDFSGFDVCHQEHFTGRVEWPLIGAHNAENALAAIAAAAAAGIDPARATTALGEFRSVKRRLQQLACVNGITVYDDFAHHPTAIQRTLEALRSKVGNDRIIAVLEPRSNTMKMGVHRQTLAPALDAADRVVLFQGPEVKWSLSEVTDQLGVKGVSYHSVDEIIHDICKDVRSGDHIVIMSNGGFDGIHAKMISAISKAA